MRGRAFLLISISLLLFYSPAFPQCSFVQSYSGQYRSSVLDIATDGNELWAATSYGVQLYDRATDPPRFVAAVAVPGVTRSVRARGGIAYVGSGSALYLVRRNGSTISIVSSVDAPGTINDLLIFDGHLFAATSNGVAHYQLLDPLNPARSQATLPTSNANVTSLAVSQLNLYTADGDSSVEQFSIVQPASPIKLGSLTSLPRSLSVNVANDKIYISDGIRTELFIGGSSAGTVSFGSTSLTQLSGDELFVAGDDRRFHALDFAVTSSPVELFESELVPSGGTINRVTAIERAGERLFVAAGDLGLGTYDLNGFGRPYPVRSHNAGSATSPVILGSRAWTSLTAGGISEHAVTSAGTLSPVRTWASSAQQIAQDAAGSFLLTSNGATVTLWALTPSTPTAFATATFRKPVVGAILDNVTVYALLDDGTLWTANLGASTPTPSQVTVSGAPSLIVRSGTAVLLGQPLADGTTRLSYFPTINFGAAPRLATIQGVPVGNVALSGATAAAFTFRGVTIIDFNAGTTAVIAGTNTSIADGLALRGTSVVEVVDRALHVYDTQTLKLKRTIALPAEGTGVAVTESGSAVVTTVDGSALVAYEAATKLPTLVGTASAANVFYRKIVTTNERAYLFDGRGIDIYNTTRGDAPDHVGGIRGGAIVDFAASADRLFTIAANGTVTSYASEGTQLAQKGLNEGNDVQAIGITTVSGAVWVSISKGCLTGGCEKKTLVLDPESLVTTATMTGAVTDLAVSGGRAHALFSLPDELRGYDLADRLHPAQTATRAIEGSATSVAVSGTTVFALGVDRLYSYAQSGLTKGNEITIGGTASDTQKIRIDGSCAIVTGRSFDPLFYTVGQWTASSPFKMPATVKSIALQPGRVLLLTDYSLEIVASGAAPRPTRRKPSR
jgi:hypothetical protein